MSSGDMTLEQAAAKQTFTGIKQCSHHYAYDGKGPVPCHPMCEACFKVWFATLDTK